MMFSNDREMMRAQLVSTKQHRIVRSVIPWNASTCALQSVAHCERSPCNIHSCIDHVAIIMAGHSHTSHRVGKKEGRNEGMKE
jgi:hypothetical protein